MREGILAFVLFFILPSFVLFSEENNKLLASEILQISREIISHSPDLIKDSSNDRIYLDEERIFYSQENATGFDLLLDEGNSLYSPLIFVDSAGPYLVTSLSAFKAKDKPLHKPFKCVCNNCDYQWCGGWLVLRCPKCGSNDFQSNVPNI